MRETGGETRGDEGKDTRAEAGHGAAGHTGEADQAAQFRLVLTSETGDSKRNDERDCVWRHLPCESRVIWGFKNS